MTRYGNTRVLSSLLYRSTDYFIQNLVFAGVYWGLGHDPGSLAASRGLLLGVCIGDLLAVVQVTEVLDHVEHHVLFPVREA